MKPVQIAVKQPPAGQIHGDFQVVIEFYDSRGDTKTETFTNKHVDIHPNCITIHGGMSPSSGIIRRIDLTGVNVYVVE